MRDELHVLRKNLSPGHSVAYCRLIETRGSSPQKAGALMLVFPDGSQAGTLGGGCVEAEVKRRALTVLKGTQPEVIDFQLDHDYGWDDGLICGGRMQVLIDPIHDQLPEYYRVLADHVEQGRGVTEAIVFDEGKSGLPRGSSFLFDHERHLLATRNVPAGQPAPAGLVDAIQPLCPRRRPYAAHGVGYLPAPLRCRLLIVGGGHVGKAVAELASQLDFDIWVIDDRAEYVSEDRFPHASRRISGPLDQILPQLEITPETYCLIVTRGHAHDQEALYYLAERDAAYVGMIGSRRKIKLIFDNLLAEGIRSEALARIYAPLGIHIGSQTVAEIAVSICAELISHRNREGVVPGRPEKIAVSSDPSQE